MNTISTQPFWTPLVIRVAVAGDQATLRRLAELDSAKTPAGDTLLAELGGRPIAALSLDDGRAIADPFEPTAEIVELLRIRAKQLRPRPEPRVSSGMPRPTRTPLVRSLRLILR